MLEVMKKGDLRQHLRSLRFVHICANLLCGVFSFAALLCHFMFELVEVLKNYAHPV